MTETTPRGVTPPREAPASEKPCVVHKTHRPTVCRTQGHHSKPQALQIELWGVVRFGPDTDSCGTGHDSIHAWIDWRLGRAREPSPHPDRNSRAEAEKTVAWYRAEKAKQGDRT